MLGIIFVLSQIRWGFNSFLFVKFKFYRLKPRFLGNLGLFACKEFLLVLFG